MIRWSDEARKESYRLRVGKYRVILEEHSGEICVLHVQKREDA